MVQSIALIHQLDIAPSLRCNFFLSDDTIVTYLQIYNKNITKIESQINFLAILTRYNSRVRQKGGFAMKQEVIIKNIRNGYENKEPSKIDELKALDKKVRRPVNILAYVFGCISALIFGTGMCLSMKVIGANLNIAIGIVIGVVGIALCISNYFLYKVFLKKRKDIYSSAILALCDEASSNIE